MFDWPAQMAPDWPNLTNRSVHLSLRLCSLGCDRCWCGQQREIEGEEEELQEEKGGEWEGGQWRCHYKVCVASHMGYCYHVALQQEGV